MRIIPVFIHYRGCPHRCVYCNEDIAAGPPTENLGEETVSQIVRGQLARLGGKEGVQVAFYGGNFTGMDPAEQERFLRCIQPFIAAGGVTGIRISTRPDAIGPADVARLKRFKVHTVEIGAQSLDDDVLRTVRRGHGVADVERAVATVRAAGMVVGLHLMVGLPGDDGGAWQRTVEKVVALRPEMVRIHPTLVLRDTPLAAAWRADTYRPLSLEAAVAACKMAVRRFREAGIAVIRLGLHETREMGEPGAVLAGPRHPAFGDLVLSALWRDEAVRLLTGRQLRGKVVTFTVPPRNMSIFRGQGNANIHFLKARFGLADLHIVPGPTLALQEVRDGA